VLLVFSMLLFQVSTSRAGVLVHETRSLNGVSVDYSNSNPQARLQSYRSALAPVFPELDVQTLEILDEFEDPTFGTPTVRLVQKYRGLTVQDAFTVIDLTKGHMGAFATSNFYKEVNLPDAGFLSQKDDSVALDRFARSFWPEIVADEQVWVLPIVLPMETSNPKDFQFHYSLNIASRQHGPARYYDWQTGTLLKESHRDAHANFLFDISHEVFDPTNHNYTLVDNEDCPGIGRAHLSDINEEDSWDCYDAVNGECSLDLEGIFLLNVCGQTEDVGIWLTGSDTENSFEYSDPWQTNAFTFAVPYGHDNTYSCDFASGWHGACEDDPAALYNLNHIARFMRDHFGAPRFTNAVTTQDQLTGGSTNSNVPAWASREAGHNVIMFGFDANIDIPGATTSKSKDVADHEYGHCFEFTCGYGDHGGGMEHEALREGVADFISASFANNHVIQRDAWSNGRYIYGYPERYCYPNMDQLEYEEHERGIIISSALWKMRENIAAYGQVPQGLDAGTYSLLLLCNALQHQPPGFAGIAEQILLHDDNIMGDNVIGNGSPNGQAIYDAFVMEYMIPVGMGINDPFHFYLGGFNYCDCDEGSAADCFPRVHSWDATTPSSSPNTGGTGFDMAYVDNGAVYYRWGIPDAEHVQDMLSMPHRLSFGYWGQSASKASISSSGQYVVWDEHYSGIDSYTHSHPCGRRITTDWGITDFDPLPSFWITPDNTHPVNSDPIAGPIMIDQLATPTMFFGVANSDHPVQENGVWYQRFNATDLTMVGTPIRVSGPGTSGVTSLSVCAGTETHPTVWVAWIEGGRVYCTYGRTGADGAITSWRATPYTLGEANRNPSNVCVAFSPEVGGIFVTWEEGPAGHPETRSVAIEKGYAVGYPPDYQFVADDIQYLNASPWWSIRNPVVASTNYWYTSFNPVNMAFEWNMHLPIPQGWWGYLWLDIDVICGLQLAVNEDHVSDPNDWEWSIPIFAGLGRSPNLYSPHDRYESYALYTGESNAAGEHVLGVQSFQPVFPEFAAIQPGRVVIDRDVALPTPIGFADSVIVEPGATLFLIAPDDAPSSEVQFFNQGRVIVKSGGTLLIKGASPSKPVRLKSGDGDPWRGIELEGGRLRIENVHMFDCDNFCISAIKPTGTDTPVDIQNCYFDGKRLIKGADAIRVIGDGKGVVRIANSRIDSVKNARGLYLFNCVADFSGDTIQGCDTSNTYLKNVTGYFSGCLFQGRSNGHGVVFDGSNCTPNFQCCTFKNLAPTNANGNALLALQGTGPTFGWEGASSGVSNVISDSASSLLYFYKDKVMPIIDNVNKNGGPGGKNDWYQRKGTGRYLYWDKTMSGDKYSAENQYWNNGVKDAYFNPTPALTYFALDTTQKNPWGLCGSGGSSSQGMAFHGGSVRGSARNGQGLDNFDDDLIMFSNALTAEVEGDYAGAQASFHSVVAATGDDQLRWQSLTHILSTQRHLDGENADGWIPALIDSAITIDSSAYSTRVYGNRLLASYRTDRGQYDDAVSICTDLLGSGLTFDDSLLVAVDLIGIQMLMGNSDGGNLDNAPASSVPAGLRVHSVAQGLVLEDQLLGQLGTRTSQPRKLEVPSNYALYQNYPNPFNPTTELRFDLPEATRVELKIFNTMGQLVATLADEVRPAGAYTLSWNGQSQNGASVASGLYIYQIRTAKFTAAKKMMLIK
jgi:hypothetical protein